MRTLVLGDTIWSPLRMIGGILLGRNVAEGNSGGGPLGFIDIALALIVHFTLSMIYSTLGGIAFRLLSWRNALLAGLALGVLLYAINFHGFAQHFEWFKEARGWPAITIHAIYGLAAAACHKFLEATTADHRAARLGTTLPT